MPAPCRCRAYKFPHRETSGKCFANESGPFCGECGKPAEAYECDSGVGWTEYWGCKSFDSRIEVLSKCCDAALFSDPELKIEHGTD